MEPFFNGASSDKLAVLENTVHISKVARIRAHRSVALQIILRRKFLSQMLSKVPENSSHETLAKSPWNACYTDTVETADF